MALVFGGPSEVEPQIAASIVLAWQRFLTVSPWEAQAVQQEIQAVFNEEFVPTAGQWAIGTVGVIDGSGFPERGKESVGVQRQWCGRLGKKLREGAKGPLAFEFARLRVWSVRHRHLGPQLWLLIRRSLEPAPEVKYYVSNAAPDTPLRTMAEVTGVRQRVEEFFEDAKGELGMAHYEARSWTSWHHHMSLVALAHLYVTQTQRDLKRKVPELTLDMAMLLLRAALPHPHLALKDAARLVEYHLAHNRQAKQSHRKRWLATHLKSVPWK